MHSASVRVKQIKVKAGGHCMMYLTEEGEECFYAISLT